MELNKISNIKKCLRVKNFSRVSNFFSRCSKSTDVNAPLFSQSFSDQYFQHRYEKLKWVINRATTALLFIVVGSAARNTGRNTKKNVSMLKPFLKPKQLSDLFIQILIKSKNSLKKVSFILIPSIERVLKLDFFYLK